MANLNVMDEVQKQAHYENTCAFLGLDPRLRLLEYFWLDSGDGTRNLVLYALRGATEALRASKGISIISTVRSDGDGYCMFTVTGTDKTGRSEQAVGAAHTRNLSGEPLAYAIMTAHTRATRRLTLQFAGCGLLDESEVKAADKHSAISPASQAELAPPLALAPSPAVQPNTDPGKDVTPIAERVAAVLTAEPLYPSKEDIEDLKSIEIKPRRKRGPKKNTVSLESVGQVSAPVMPPSVAEPVETQPMVAVQAEEIKVEYHVPLPPHVGETVIGIPTPIQDSRIANSESAPHAAISQEKQIEYRKRLAVYLNDVLPKAGMQHSESLGISAKIRLFARKHLQLAHDLQFNQVTEQQWESLMSYLDSYLAVEGAQALARHIDQVVLAAA